jgi:hypothetical protein
MQNIKVWPHLTIVAVVCALIAGLAVAFYFKHEPTAQAEAIPNAARIQRVDGEVAYTNTLSATDNNTQWITAESNQPFSVGDRIYTRDNSRASLAFTGRNFARLNPDTGLDVIALNDSCTQLALRDGSATFDVGYLAPNELYEVGTPYGAVDFTEPGLYNVDVRNDNAIVSVLNGLAQVVGAGGSGRISKGEMLTLAGAAASQVVLSQLDHRNAGYVVDDYYRYEYPSSYDGRYSNYDAYLDDPYYYDPSRRSVSYQYAPSTIPGLYDLDSYGDWQDVASYGHCWRPRVDADWAPYQSGYWMNDYPYGPTWVSSEPWGYAPYHYGRWASVNNQWFWVPDPVNATPVYSPALVAFVPFSDVNQIGWVPLGPGDPYVARYYDPNWQPYYVTRNQRITTQLVNLVVPNAVTVVQVNNFGQPIDRRDIHRVNAQMLAGVRPVLDPLTLTPLRNAALHSAWGRGKTDLPPGIAKKLFETRVITSVAPPAPPFRKDLAKFMRLDQVPEKARHENLNFRDDRQQARGIEKQQAELAAQAAKGDKDARRQMQQLQLEQRKQQVDQQRAAQQAQRVQLEQQKQQAQGERVGRRAQEQPHVEMPRPERHPLPPQVERKPRPQPQVMQQPRPRPQVIQQPRHEQQVIHQPRPHPQVMQQPRPQVIQPRREPPQHVQQQPAPKHEPAAARHGPPAQPAAQSQGAQPSGGKGKGKKP